MSRKRMTAEQALEQVALRNHATVEEVRKQIQLAMLVGMCNPDPTVQAKWKSIPCEGEVPTPEEMISYIAGEIVR